MTEHSESRDAGLDLAELVDLELQLHRDRSADPAQVRRRDAGIGREICADGVPASRAQVLRRWLQALEQRRPRSAPTPGRRLAAAYRLASWSLIFVGLASGASAAAALLRYDGGDPVNVISYLAVLVGLQWLMISFAATSMLPAALRRRFSPLGPLHAALRELGVRRAGFESAVAKLGRRAGADAGTLGVLGSVYGEAERWRLLAITGRAAVAFNIGAVAASFYRVAVTALAFAWSTTLDVDAVSVHRITTVMSLPWSWISDAVPSLALIEASRYFPGGHYDPALLGDWWPFLLACLLTYGLLPRVLLLALAERRGRRARASLALDHGDARLAYERLTAGWAADTDTDCDSDGSRAAEAVGSGPRIAGSCRVVVWADAAVVHAQLEPLVRDRVGCERVVESATLDDAAADGIDAVVVVAEAWEAPTRALGRRLAELRERLGDTRPIVVMLVGQDNGDGRRAAGSNDVAVWRHHLAGLGDPYLFLNAVSADGVT